MPFALQKDWYWSEGHGKEKKLPITLLEMSELIETTCKAPWVSVVEDQARYEYLEELYRKSGRDQVGHPMHSLYTGLYQESLGGVAVEAVHAGQV